MNRVREATAIPARHPGPDRLRVFASSAAAPLLVLLCYLPLVFIEYGVGEDYRLLAAYDRGEGFRGLSLAEGRPGFALWVRLVFSVLPDVSSLRYVRLLNILVLAALAVTIRAAWIRAGWRRGDATIAAVVALTLPSFQLLAASASIGSAPCAALAGAGAAFFALAASAAQVRSRRINLHIAASTLLLLGLVTYQPAGLIYFAFAIILLIAPNASPSAFTRAARAFIIVAVPAFVAAFLVFLVGRAAFRPYLLNAPRSHLQFDPAGKAVWFLLRPLPHALNLWKLRPDLYFALAMLIGLATGMVLHLRSTTLAWRRGLLACALLPLCYAPNLIVVENHSSFRSMTALSVAVLGWYLIVIHDQFATTRRRFFDAVLVAMLLAGLYFGATTPMRMIALPQARELRAARAAVAGFPSAYRSIAVVPSDYRDSLASNVLYGEFGYPSTGEPFSLRTTYVLMRELHPTEDTAAIRILPADSLDGVLPDTTIDWGRVLRETRASR